MERIELTPENKAKLQSMKGLIEFCSFKENLEDRYQTQAKIIQEGSKLYFVKETVLDGIIEAYELTSEHWDIIAKLKGI